LDLIAGTKDTTAFYVQSTYIRRYYTSVHGKCRFPDSNQSLLHFMLQDHLEYENPSEQRHHGAYLAFRSKASFLSRPNTAANGLDVPIQHGVLIAVRLVISMLFPTFEETPSTFAPSSKIDHFDWLQMSMNSPRTPCQRPRHLQ
jgi:hypothetical protein